jgi:hypothetical protein
MMSLFVLCLALIPSWRFAWHMLGARSLGLRTAFRNRPTTSVVGHLFSVCALLLLDDLVAHSRTVISATGIEQRRLFVTKRVEWPQVTSIVRSYQRRNFSYHLKIAATHKSVDVWEDNYRSPELLRRFVLASASQAAVKGCPAEDLEYLHRIRQAKSLSR